MRAMRRPGFALGMVIVLFGLTGCMAAAPTGLAVEARAARGGPATGVAVEAGAFAPAQPAPAPPPPPAGPAADSAYGEANKEYAPRSAPSERPGLGTQWGETRASHISSTSFTRSDFTRPYATAAIYYNDEEGAQAVSGTSGFYRTPRAAFPVASGLVQVGLRGDHSGFLPGFVAGGRNYVIGEAGQRYSIVIRNMTNFRIEVVVSVDGLDVLDGQAAGFSKRGYVLDPRDEVDIDGFRQSMDTVAAFRFGSVRGSYAAQKHGDTRNVGVIGVAVFNERGTSPVPWTADEVQRRRDANPFPGQFATPP